MFYFKRIKNWTELVQLIDDTQPSYTEIVAGYKFYRGQSNSDWRLQSTLARIVKGDPISEKKAKYYEFESQVEFAGKIHLLDAKLSYTKPISVESLVDMQHYSFPTRLIDWSSSPYLGIYFAVNENFEHDGALFIWDTRFYDKKIKSENKLEISPETIIDFNEYDTITMISAIRKNERMLRQNGHFSISNNLLKNHCDLINEVFASDEPCGLFKIEIPKDLKIEFLARLKKMNISAESLFPGIDGLGRSIKEQMLIRKWSRQ